MAPVPFQHPVRYAPLAAVGTHLASVIYFTYAIAASLYISYKSLGPAQDTRSRLAQRKRLVPVFIGLATAAFFLATYTSATSAILSYKTWAHEHGVDRPENYAPDEELFPEPEKSGKLNLTFIAHWLSDTSVYFDTLEIVAEKARRFWWGQQIDLATVAFSVLLSIEGRRRKIPFTSAFLVLAHLVNLSFAQNLFYLALLLTPTPLSSGNRDLELPVIPVRSSRLVQLRDKLVIRKPDGWYLYPFILVTSLAVNYSSIFILPYAAETPSFGKIALLARVSTFLPLILPEIAPVSWGAIHSRPHDAYGSFTAIFRTISAASFALHVKSSITGLAYNIPSSNYHRHSVFLPWDVEERTAWERSTTALAKVLSSIYDHPAVEAVGLDVMVSAFSLGLWAAVRATDTHDILRSIIPIYNVRHEVRQTIEDKTPITPIKTDSEPTEDVTPDHPMILRSRRRSVKSRVGSVASSSGPSEDGVRTPGRRRGRPKKTKQTEEEKDYTPSSPETRELVEGDILPDNGLDWEATALTWGLSAFAGLGSASAGVWGGECISR